MNPNDALDMLDMPNEDINKRLNPLPLIVSITGDESEKHWALLGDEIPSTEEPEGEKEFHLLIQNLFFEVLGETVTVERRAR